MRVPVAATVLPPGKYVAQICRYSPGEEGGSFWTTEIEVRRFNIPVFLVKAQIRVTKADEKGRKLCKMNLGL